MSIRKVNVYRERLLAYVDKILFNSSQALERALLWYIGIFVLISVQTFTMMKTIKDQMTVISPFSFSSKASRHKLFKELSVSCSPKE